MWKKRLAIVLGIRPDVIRSSINLEILRSEDKKLISFGLVSITQTSEEQTSKS